jgi:hypothetical protein
VRSLTLAVACLTTCVAASPHSPARAEAPDSGAFDHAHAPTIRAARLRRDIRIDGRLDDAAWNAAEPIAQFTQLDPHEGMPASESTSVRVAIGEDALYVGARLFDREPHAVKARLARRDDPVESDVFEVLIDSYHDHLTGWRFRVNPAGAIYDAAIGADGSENASWNPVWQAAARVDSAGWTSEIRIPLSQLRYADLPEQIWGIQFVRSIFRKGETDYFSFTPKKEQGGVSRFGHLTGLGRLPAPRRLEILPYTLARNERLQFPAGDPFRSHSDYFGAAGADIKYGVTSNVTLDATVNPDFGQVEVDPAEVNLTAFETFFPEQRPFFVEGADLFTFGRSRAQNQYGFVRLFHSRRIGRAPQLVLAGPAYGDVDAPMQTTIAGALKLTGKTRGGWSIGALDALTTKEEARYVDGDGVSQETAVEPLTHYFAGRLKRDLRAGNTVVGGLVTVVNRRLDDPLLASLLRRDAYVGGLDLNHAWGRRHWAFDASVAASDVRGTPSAIAVAQRSSARYLQRPDHGDYFTYDPMRTSLRGTSAEASVARIAGLHWTGSVAYSMKSPGFEVNDLGFITRADYRATSEILLYQENKPGRVLRNYVVFPYANQAWNFGGDMIFNSCAADFNGQFANYWSFDVNSGLNLPVYDDRLTRGGPQARLPRSQSWSAYLATDSRKSGSLSWSVSQARNEFGGYGNGYGFTASLRASPTLRLAFEPEYSRTHALAQYVFAFPDAAALNTFGRRYVFATLDQRTLSLVTRVDWTFTPRLSMQLYVQPLVVSGAYSHFKEFTTPRVFAFAEYGKDRGSIARDSTGTYVVDPGDGGDVFQIGDPDFTFGSLLGNAVVRWEYRPGSTIYLVWQQRRTDEEPFGDLDFHRDFTGLFHRRPENIFVLKATYWVGL